MESMNGIAHALGGAAQLPGNLRGALPARTGEQDPAPPQREGLRGVQPGFQLVAFLGTSRSHIQGWFHAT
jgi:hypothetical protein